MSLGRNLCMKGLNCSLVMFSAVSGVPEGISSFHSLSRVRLFATLQTVAHHAPLSMRFSRQEYWSGLPFPPPGDLPDSGIKPMPLMSPALAGGFFTTGTAWKAQK